MRFTYIGGPTALIEFGGLRFLTDPTFDAAPEEYRTKLYTLRKTKAPAIERDAIGRVDAVLLTHDHHFDNLDRSGRTMLRDAPMVLTTHEASHRVVANAIGLSPWSAMVLRSPEGGVKVTAAPARHGPADGDRGPVVGFVLEHASREAPVVYVSGDTVWYEGVAEVARRFRVGAAVLFLGAARVREVGPAHLTFTAPEAVEAARAFAGADIIPLHYEGWGHFSEGRAEVDAAFAAAGLADRLHWPAPGSPRSFDLQAAPLPA